MANPFGIYLCVHSTPFCDHDGLQRRICLLEILFGIVSIVSGCLDLYKVVDLEGFSLEESCVRKEGF